MAPLCCSIVVNNSDTEEEEQMISEDEEQIVTEDEEQIISEDLECIIQRMIFTVHKVCTCLIVNNFEHVPSLILRPKSWDGNNSHVLCGQIA